MGLGVCPDCKHEVSDSAKSCVNCGRPGPFKSAKPVDLSKYVHCPKCEETRYIRKISQILQLQEVTTTRTNVLYQAEPGQIAPALLTTSTTNVGVAELKRRARGYIRQPITAWKSAQRKAKNKKRPIAGWLNRNPRTYSLKLFILVVLFIAGLTAMAPVAFGLFFLGSWILFIAMIIILIKAAKGPNPYKYLKKMDGAAKQELSDRMNGWYCIPCNSFFPNA